MIQYNQQPFLFYPIVYEMELIGSMIISVLEMELRSL